MFLTHVGSLVILMKNACFSPWEGEGWAVFSEVQRNEYFRIILRNWSSVRVKEDKKNTFFLYLC